MFLSPFPSQGNVKGMRASKPHGTSAFHNFTHNTSANISLAKANHVDKPRVVWKGMAKLHGNGWEENFARVVNNIPDSSIVFATKRIILGMSLAFPGS